MKQVLAFLLVLVLVSPVLGQQDPYESEQGEHGAYMVFFGITTDPSDTFWHPGYEVQDVSSGGDSVNIPNIVGWNLTQYKYLGIEVTTLQADTTLNDSLLVDVYTGYYGHVDSLISAVAYTEVTDGALFDTCTIFPDCPKAIKWVHLADTTESPAFWFQKYAWLRLRTHMTTVFATDTILTSAVVDDVYEATPESLRGWWATNGNDSWETEIDEAIGATDWADFVSVEGKDSLLVCALGDPIPENPGTIDSIVFTVIVKESLETVSSDTLCLGIVFGDTTLDYFGKLGTPIWATQQAVVSYFEDTGHDTLTFTFTTDPYGNPWTRTTLDSVLVIFDPVWVDTLTGANGTLGMMKLVQFWAKTYHSRTELSPALKYRATIWLKK